MTPYWQSGPVSLFHGDCRKVMAGMQKESVHAIVTDPPYELGFMGKSWDSSGIAYDTDVWMEALRVLKPGGHLLAFGGSRTYHRMAVAIEDSGFELRDSIAWLYGSGFPKSLDVSKAIDKAAGVTREVVGPGRWHGRQPNGGALGQMNDDGWVSKTDAALGETAPATEAAKTWQGWGTALKPAFEPIVVARKPIAGTVAGNVLEHGNGALNIAGCRVGDEVRRDGVNNLPPGNRFGDHGTQEARQGTRSAPKEYVGRWPTNVVLDESQAAELDLQSGVKVARTGGPRPVFKRASGADALGNTSAALGVESRAAGSVAGVDRGDGGGASRFFPTFKYEAKAPSSERPVVDGVAHATVKPLALMRWLVRLVTPPGGVVLDPFAGSGTTLEAAVLEGFDSIGIEREEAHLPLIKSRFKKPFDQYLDLGDVG